jgi:predicted phage terminase large subunit-like protein
MSEQQVIGPQSKFQEDYLQSNARILVAGGAAGSSKSHIGLMRHLRWMHDPLYRGFCIRKNSTAIMKSGGLFDAAVHLYSQVDDIKIKMKDQKIVFSSGASVSFSHYENDKAGQLYHGLELSNVFYDECTHASESHIWWLVSRLRTKANLDPSIWLSANPDPDSFLFDWVKWWLYPEGHEKYGMPDPEKNGTVRWLIRKEGVIFWGDSREEMIVRYGNPNLPMDHPKQIKPLSFQVILGTIYDNPYLIENQPEYLASLEALPDVERRRLLLGDWTAREQTSTHFLRTWVTEDVVEPAASDIVKTVRSYDFAGTLKSDGNPSPDYFATSKVSKLKDGSYFVHDVQRTRIRFGDWEDFILKIAYQDGFKVDIVLPEDPNPAAKAATKILARSIAEKGFYVRTVRSSTSKLDRFRPFSSLAMNGHVRFLKNCGTDHENKIYNDLNFVYTELERFTGLRKSGEANHDDIVDTLSDNIYVLTSTLTNIPTISFPSMSKSNEFRI